MRISDWSSDVCSSDLIIARVLRGALIGHDHRLNANIIEKMVLGSTAIVMPSPQVGATAPLLTAIELQVEHLRTVNRMSRRSEERRVGKECVSTCRSRWSPYP